MVRVLVKWAFSDGNRICLSADRQRRVFHLTRMPLTAISVAGPSSFIAPGAMRFTPTILPSTHIWVKHGFGLGGRNPTRLFESIGRRPGTLRRKRLEHGSEIVCAHCNANGNTRQPRRSIEKGMKCKQKDTKRAGFKGEIGGLACVTSGKAHAHRTRDPVLG